MKKETAKQLAKRELKQNRDPLLDRVNQLDKEILALDSKITTISKAVVK